MCSDYTIGIPVEILVSVFFRLCSSLVVYLKESSDKGCRGPC